MLIYLDHSTVVSLAKDEEPELLEVLRSGVRAGTICCPESLEHGYEAVLAPEEDYLKNQRIMDELSLGLSFIDRDAAPRREIEVALAAFLGLPAPFPVWREAFHRDPHTPNEELFPSGYRVSITMPKVDWHEAESRRQKELALDLRPYFVSVEDFGATAENTVRSLIRGEPAGLLLGLVEPAKFEAWRDSLIPEVQRQMQEGRDLYEDDSPFSKWQFRRGLGNFLERLRRQYPGLSGREEEFLSSPPLHSMPSVVLYSLLFAGLLAIPGRKAKRGDLYDVFHLRWGLARCDIVTADKGMKSMCVERGLVPKGVEIFSAAELSDLTAHLRTRLTPAETQ